MKWIPGAENLTAMSSLYGSGFFFLIGFLLYGRSAPSQRRSIAGGASVVGMFAGLAYTICLCRLLCRME